MTDIKKILFIEDEQFVSELYTTALKESGFEVACAYDGRTGLDMARQTQYDLILLDLMLPWLSGMEVLTSMRDPATSPSFLLQTPVYVFTNFEEDDITKQKLRELSQGYLLKVNITPHILAQMIKDGRSEPSPKTSK
jgi:DNA-binding response OmpR family regulator